MVKKLLPIILTSSIISYAPAITLKIVNEKDSAGKGTAELFAIVDPGIQRKARIEAGEEYMFLIPDDIQKITVRWTTRYTYSWPVYDYIWAREGGDPLYGTSQKYILNESNVALTKGKKNYNLRLQLNRLSFPTEHPWNAYSEQKLLLMDGKAVPTQEIQRVNSLNEIQLMK